MSIFVHNTAKLGQDPHLGENVVILEGVRIGSGVQIGNNTVIHPYTEIGDGVMIHDNSVIGRQPKLSATSTVKLEGSLPPLVIGEETSIGSSVVLYAGTKIGKKAMIADFASVREKCVIGDYVVVGRGVAVENETTIGDYTKIQTGAYITAYMVIEDHVFIAPMVTTTNDNFMGRTEKRFALKKGAHIKRGARVGANSILLPAITIGEDSFVAAGAIVTKDVPARMLAMGIPARVIRPVPEEELLENQR